MLPRFISLLSGKTSLKTTRIIKRKVTFAFLIVVLTVTTRGQEVKWLNPLPQGDNVRQIFFANEQRGWMVVSSSNIMMTVDGGLTWSLVPISVSLHRISFVNELEGWAIGSQHPLDVKVGIYKTTDGGYTWGQQLGDTTGLRYDIKFTDRNNGWAIGQGILWHTNNGGITWSQQAGSNFVRPAGGEYAISFRDSLHGWIGGWMFYASTTSDGGTTWMRDSSMGYYNRFVFVDSLIGWAGTTIRGNSSIPIKRTTDGGLTWQITPQPITALPIPLSSTKCIAFADGVYLTENAGLTWTKIANEVFADGLFLSNMVGWSWQSNTARWYKTTDGGDTWNNLLTDAFGEVSTIFYAVDFVHNVTGWVIGSSFNPTRNSFVAKTTDGAASWLKQVDQLENEPLNLSFINKNLGWIVGRNGLIMKTYDGGSTWSDFTGITSHPLWSVQFIDTLHGWIVGGTPELVGEPSQGIAFRTTNGGQTWLNDAQGVTSALKWVQFVDSLYGWALGSSVFLRTVDGGRNWTTVVQDGTKGFEASYFVSRARGWAVILDEVIGGRIMATTDSGRTWQEQSRFMSRYASFTSIEFANSLHGWITGFSGFIASTKDGGAKWNYKTGATSLPLEDLRIMEGKVWIVGMNGSILSVNIDANTSVSREGDEMITSSAPADVQNYPNPFNSSTSILFNLARESEVVIYVFDVLGRLVNSFDLGILAKGRHQHLFHTRFSTTGILFYQIVSADGIGIGKMVVIK